MKIFLNERTIQFHSSLPANLMPADLAVEYQSAEKLKEAWEEFKRYDKYRTFFIVEPGFQHQSASPAFASFVSFFKFIIAAGGLVKNEKGDHLFIHRLGFWDLPKGKIDKKDLPGSDQENDGSLAARRAAIREVREETGLKTVVITKELASTWHIYSVKEKDVLKETRWFEMSADSTQTLKPQTSEGIFLVKWTPNSAIHCVLSHTYGSIRELLVDVVF